MHTIVFLVITSGLVIFQTTLGLTQDVGPDFFDEVAADGFIVATNGPTISEKIQSNNNAVITNDSINPEEIISVFHSVPTESIATVPVTLNKITNKVIKTENGAVYLITVGSSQSSLLFPEENAEGSANLPGGSGMFLETLDERQDKELQFTTTVRNSGDVKTSTLSSEENGGSGMGPEAPISDWLTTTPTISLVKSVNAENMNIKTLNKPVDRSGPDSTEKVLFQPKPRLSKEFVNEPDTQMKEGTPGWLFILALCLTVGAVVCVSIGIATKDMWYGPSKRCLNINSTDSKKHKEYDKAAALSMSEKKIVALMGSQKAEGKETDYTIISLEEVPEKEYLM
ncbi:hypothetical protein Baya_1562 [Bagarius yarrelli]|uniref:Uncharacterized protein n=1 Tax=Bagarius yarrelli TaxID=175774 RepID=A0A556TLH1_BAGYA|nr:hypothetical protein Baya_1562 [Bagarius yarrelli]